MVTPMIRPGIFRECLEDVERKAACGPPKPIGTVESVKCVNVRNLYGSSTRCECARTSESLC